MKKSTIIILWGTITALACAGHKTILIAQDISLSGWAYLNWLIFFLGLFIGIKQVKDKLNGGYMKFGEGYVISLLMTLIIAVVSGITTVIILRVMPDLGDRLLNEMHIRLVNAGLTEDMVDKIMESEKRVYTPTMITVGGFFGPVIGGAIIGLIAAGVNAKKKPMFDDAEEVDSTDTKN